VNSILLKTTKVMKEKRRHGPQLMRNYKSSVADTKVKGGQVVFVDMQLKAILKLITEFVERLESNGCVVYDTVSSSRTDDLLRAVLR
jgi:hypothetical protein